MGYPPQGMGGINDADRKRDSKQHRDIIIIGIISITVALIIGVPTMILVMQTGDVLEKIKDIETVREERENFPPIISISSSSSLVLEAGHAENQTIIATMSVSSISPHHLELIIDEAKLRTIEISSSCDFSPQLFIDQPIVKYIDKDVVNLDFDFPIKFSSDPDMFSPPPTNSTFGTTLGGSVLVNIEIEDLQTNESIGSKSISIPLKIRAGSFILRNNC